MAFRALLFSKSAEATSALTAACQNAGIQLEACDDIFSAMEKGTRQTFSCVLADWSDQPEAGFLLKRARESASNINTVAIAIVEREPAAAEMRDHRLDFLIYRPIAAQEAQDVLAKAAEKMPSVAAETAPARRKPSAQPEESPRAAVPFLAQENVVEHPQDEIALIGETSSPDLEADAEVEAKRELSSPDRRFSPRQAVAAVLVLGAAYFLWSARDTVIYLMRTRENRASVFKDSVAALFYLNPSPTPVGAASTEAQQDAYFSRSAGNSTTHLQLGVASTEAEVSESRVHMRQPSEFPLPNPVYEHPAAPPVAAPRTSIPDSLRGAAPITPPVVVTVNPAQMMPVSAPAAPPLASQQVSEPVAVSEEAERALLVHSVTPAYPPEANAQKLRGPVVLQATIGRDGSVEDLKIVRGSFLLCKAAIAAVKQWRFQPYTLNGRAVETQTFLTVSFTSPPN